MTEGFLVRDFSARRLLLRRLLSPIPARFKPLDQRLTLLTGINGDVPSHEAWRELDEVELSESTYRATASEAFELGTTWLSDPAFDTCRDGLVIHGVDIAEVCAWETYYCFFSVMLTMQRIRALIATGPPSSLHLVGDAAWNRLITWLSPAGTAPSRDLLRLRLMSLVLPRVIRKASLSRTLGFKPSPGHLELPTDRVLFLVTGGSTDAVGRDTLHIAERSFPCAIVGPSHSGRGFQTSNSPYVPFTEIIDGDAARVPPLAERAIAHVVHQLRSMSFRYLEVDMAPVLSPWLAAFVRQRFAEAACFVSGIRPAFESCEARALVASGFEGDWITCAIIRTAQTLSWPTLTLQTADFTSPVLPRIKSQVMAVQGIKTRERLVADGNHSGRIIVTGQPRYDRVLQQTPPWEGTDLYLKYGVPRGVKVLAFATDPGTGWGSIKDKLTTERIVIDEMRNHPGWHLLLKLHPQDKGQHTHDLVAAAHANNISFVEGPEAHEVIALCDAWMCMNSTTAQEALLQGKPVFLAAYSGPTLLSEMVEEGVATVLTEPGDLSRALVQILPTDAQALDRRRLYIESRLGPQDGQASERVVAAIRAIARQR